MSKKLLLLYLAVYTFFMKKLALFLMVAVALFTVSCTREFTCQCTVKYSGNHPGLPDSSTHEFSIMDVKKQAIKKCEANSLTVTEQDITMDEKCRLY